MHLQQSQDKAFKNHTKMRSSRDRDYFRHKENGKQGEGLRLNGVVQEGPGQQEMGAMDDF